jgi:hypothetical protein
MSAVVSSSDVICLTLLAWLRESIFFIVGLLGRVDLCGMKNKQHEDKV